MKPTTDFDAVVVGSGITGGLAAKELTEQGLRVLVLERGKPLKHGMDYKTEHLPTWQMPNRNLPDRKLYAKDYSVQRQARGFDFTTLQYWNNDRENPYVQTPDQPYNWFRGGAVGGRSTLWGRQCYRWSDLDFNANRLDGHGNDWPIRYADLKDWYSHVERFIGVSGRAEDLPQLPDGEFLPPMAFTAVEKSFKSRVEAKFHDRRVTIGRVANLTAPLADRGACHYCGPCNRGCSVGAAFSSQSSTLPAAEKTGRMTLRPFSVVERLDYDPVARRIRAIHVIDAVTNERIRFTSRLVFLCASTFASQQILLNSTSEQFPNGLANSSGTLGRYVMDHQMGAGAIGAMPGFEDKYYYGNRPNGILVPRFRNLDGIDKDVQFHRGYTLQGFSSVDSWAATWDKTPGFGVDFKKKMRHPGSWMIGFFGFGEVMPYADNRVVLDRQLDRFGIPQLRFEIRYRENERLMQEDITRQATTLLEAGGATSIVSLTKPLIPGTSIHEFGGARMGADPRESVLNAHNQAHDVRNLFVTDGSCMASTSSVNPSLTFMALTARASEYAVTALKEQRV